MNATGNSTSGTDHSNGSYATMDDQEPFQIVVNVLLTLTTLLILVLNPLSLVVLCRAGGIQHTTKILMASLTISDICTGFIAVGLLTESLSGEWVLGEFLCNLSRTLGPVSVAFNVNSLVLLTIDRYIAIVYSLRYAMLMTTKRAKILVALVLGWSTAINVVLYIVKTQTEGQVESDDSCLTVHCNSCVTVRILSFSIPLLVILVLYLRILKIARDQARRIAAQNPVGECRQGQNAPQRISTKSVTTVLIITAAVCVSWTAPVLLNIFLAKDLFNTQHPIYTFGATIYYTNNWLNVVIYYWRNKELRQALRSLIASSCR